MHRSLISRAMQEKRPTQSPRSGFWDAWFGGLDPLPGDEDLGKQPSPLECFSTMSRKQVVGALVITLAIGALGYAILPSFFALSSH